MIMGIPRRVEQVYRAHNYTQRTPQDHQAPNHKKRDNDTSHPPREHKLDFYA